VITPPISVSASGAVILGNAVVCDGFVRDLPYRVQTHIHSDHFSHFETSKGAQDILLTEPTRRLLINDLNADLVHRQNLKALQLGQPFHFPGGSVSVLSNGHMLGSVQVCVTYENGLRLGYSSDFAWPLDEVIQVDALVVDSTCGAPSSVRKYSQRDAEERLIQIVNQRRGLGAIHIRAHRGTLQRALQLLSSEARLPILGSRRLVLEALVYREHGYMVSDVVDVKTPEGKEILQAGDYVRIFGSRDTLPTDPHCATTINLSAFGLNGDDPVLVYNEGSYRVALSDHADFEGTMDYIAATNACFVLTDNSRGGHAFALADAIRQQLGIAAKASENTASKEWGV
jgi:putative mRNA 3-end processing factor